MVLTYKYSMCQSTPDAHKENKMIQMNHDQYYEHGRGMTRYQTGTDWDVPWR